MGHRNQFDYLTSRVPPGPGRILEVGSRQVGSTQPFRAFYRGAEYVGLDLYAGERVDVVQDLMDGPGPLERASFDLVICCSVLEHVRRPWVVADVLTYLLRPGGTLYIAAPFVWRFHAYPDDYFRFTWRGIEELFPELSWRDFQFSTDVVGDFMPCAPKADNYRAQSIGGVKFLPYLEVHGLGQKG